MIKGMAMKVIQGVGKSKDHVMPPHSNCQRPEERENGQVKKRKRVERGHALWVRRRSPRDPAGREGRSIPAPPSPAELQLGLPTAHPTREGRG